MCFGPSIAERRRTKEEAAAELSDLFRRHGMYVADGALMDLVRDHWSKVAVLAHAIHDDWRPVQTAMDAAMIDQPQPQ